MVLSPHEDQLDLILNVLDMERSARGEPAEEALHDLIGQPFNQLVNTATGCSR